MSSTFRDSKKAYVRETAARLTTASATALSQSSAFTLACLFQDLVNAAKKSEIDFYIPILEACQQLCEAAEQRNFSDHQMQQANEILRESILTFQTSLFTFALYSDPERHESKLKEVITNIIQFLKNVQANPLLNSGEQPQTDESELIIPAPKIASEYESSNANSSEQADLLKDVIPAPAEGPEVVLNSVALLAEKVWNQPELRKETLQMANSVLRTFGSPFSEICNRIANSLKVSLRATTPDFRVERALISSIGSQLETWLELQSSQPVKAVASLRQIGKIVVLELCLRDRFVMTSETLIKKGKSQIENSQIHSGDLSQTYIDSQGDLIQRKGFDLTLPLFEAYKVIANQRVFLIPALDVIAKPTKTLSNIPRFSLKDFPGFKSHSQKGFLGKIGSLNKSKANLLVLWRETQILLEVDHIEGPEFFYSRSSDDFQRNSYFGYSTPIDDQNEGMIIDICPWLDLKHQITHSTTIPSEEAHSEVTSKKMLIFKIGEIRMVIPADKILECGELGDHALGEDTIELKGRIFKLKSAKKSIGLKSNIPEKFYMIISTSQGPVVWAVSQLDGIHVFPRLKVQSLELGEPLGNIQFIEGTVNSNGILKGFSSKNSFYLVNPSNL